MQDLFYGSLEERETLAKAITNKGGDTNVSDTLSTMATNVSNIIYVPDMNFTGQLGSFDGQSDGIPSYVIIPTVYKKKLIINSFTYSYANLRNVKVDIWGIDSEGSQTLLTEVADGTAIPKGATYDISTYATIKLQYLVVYDTYNSWFGKANYDVTLTDS